MATLFSDSYTAADTTNMGANYTESSGDTQIVSNRARLSANNPGILRTTTTAHAAVADVKVSVTIVNGGASTDGGPAVRVVVGKPPTLAAGGGNFYALECWTSGTGIAQLYRYDDSVANAVLLETGIGITIAANAIAALQASGSGATVTLTYYYQGVLLSTFPDSNTKRITTATQTAIHNWAVAGVNSDYDNFLVEDLGAPVGNLAWVTA